MAYLRCRDPFERTVLEAVIDTATEALIGIHEYQAKLIAQAVWG